MNITAYITEGMTAQEKEIYFEHMRKRHQLEQLKLIEEKQELLSWKRSLIDEIIAKNPEYEIKELQKMTTRRLEATAGY